MITNSKGRDHAALRQTRFHPLLFPSFGKVALIMLLVFAAHVFGLQQTQTQQTPQTQTQKNRTRKRHHAARKILFEPTSYEKATVVKVKGKEWKYYEFSQANPLILEVNGTTVLYFRVRLIYDITMKGLQPFTLAIQEKGLLANTDLLSYSFKAKKSSVSVIKNDPQMVPSAAHEFKLTVPDGAHRYIFNLKGTPASAALLRILINKKDLEKEG